MDDIISALFSVSDEQLMWRVKQQDDPHAFADLMMRWRKRIEHVCARMTGDRHRAEDLTQTAFARVFAGRREWEPTGRFSTFLWRIAVNLCHDELRRTKRRGECSLDALDEQGSDNLEFLAVVEPPPDAQAESDERAELVRGPLLRLAPRYREVLVLRHYECLKFHEIAQVLAIPAGTVKSRMAEGLNQLTRLLKPLNGDIICDPNHQTPKVPVL